MAESQKHAILCQLWAIAIHSAILASSKRFVFRGILIKDRTHSQWSPAVICEIVCSMIYMQMLGEGKLEN